MHMLIVTQIECKTKIILSQNDFAYFIFYLSNIINQLQVPRDIFLMFSHCIWFSFSLFETYKWVP